ncbi:MAG: hypothetical protein H6613_12750 [Ignavibacteriales bacterium]|nr:hypothetical protein [Ignavibacteriales bacterium]
MSALGPMAQQENEGIQKVWNAPMAGFYTYGEYGKGINGKHEIHSTTCSWVALKENNNFSKYKEISYEKRNDKSKCTLP